MHRRTGISILFNYRGEQIEVVRHADYRYPMLGRARVKRMLIDRGKKVLRTPSLRARVPDGEQFEWKLERVAVPAAICRPLSRFHESTPTMIPSFETRGRAHLHPRR